jgi:hypothetical protein
MEPEPAQRDRVRSERIKEATMARMDLRLRRDAPGMSVFWMILILGAAVFLLLAIVLMTWGGAEQVEEEGHVITAGEGDEVPGTSSFTEGEVSEAEAPPEDAAEELGEESGELDEAVPGTGEADDSEAAGTAGAVDADPAEDASPADAGAEETEAAPAAPATEPAQPAPAESEAADGEETEAEEAPAEEGLADGDTEPTVEPGEEEEVPEQ